MEGIKGTLEEEESTLKKVFAKQCAHAKLLQLYLTPCNPMDCNLPGSSVHGIIQPRISEQVAMPSSRGSPQLRDRTHVSFVSFIGRQVLYHQCHLGSPCKTGLSLSLCPHISEALCHLQDAKSSIMIC